MSKIKIKISVNPIFAVNTLPFAQERADALLPYLPDNTRIDSIFQHAAHVNQTMDEYTVTYDCPFFTNDMELEPVYRVKLLSDGNPQAVFDHYYNVLEEFKVLSSSPSSAQIANAITAAVANPTFIGVGVDDFKGLAGFIPSGKDASTCNHDWMWYHGFTDTYEYCSKCNKKRD